MTKHRNITISYEGKQWMGDKEDMGNWLYDVCIIDMELTIENNGILVIYHNNGSLSVLKNHFVIVSIDGDLNAVAKEEWENNFTDTM